MESKTINRKQGVGLICTSSAALIGVIAGYIPKDYGWLMIGLAILLFVAGLFLFFKYQK